MTKTDWVCTECMWEGLDQELEDGRCPICDAKVEESDGSPQWKYHNKVECDEV